MYVNLLVQSDTSVSYDLKEAYDAKHGIPTTAAPKVFMKYFFVNTVTGEKSGEMMAVVTLKDDEVVGD